MKMMKNIFFISFLFLWCGSYVMSKKQGVSEETLQSLLSVLAVYLIIRASHGLFVVERVIINTFVDGCLMSLISLSLTRL